MAIKNLEAIEQSLHLEKGTLKAAIDNESDVDISIPELHISSKADHEKLMNNIEADKKSRYDSGVEKGEKEAVLRAAKSLGLEIGEDKAKKIDNLLPLFKDRVMKEAKIEPDKRISSLESDIEKLRENYKTLETEHENLKSSYENEKQGLKIDKDIMSSIPKENITYNVGDDDLLYLVKRKQKFAIKDGKTLAIGEDGEPLKNSKTLDPKALSEIVTELVKPYVTKGGGGRGDDDYVPGQHEAGTYEAFMEEMEKTGKKPGSEEFQLEMQKRIANKTLKI